MNREKEGLKKNSVDGTKHTVKFKGSANAGLMVINYHRMVYTTAQECDFDMHSLHGIRIIPKLCFNCTKFVKLSPSYMSWSILDAVL